MPKFIFQHGAYSKDTERGHSPLGRSANNASGPSLWTEVRLYQYSWAVAKGLGFTLVRGLERKNLEDQR